MKKLFQYALLATILISGLSFGQAQIPADSSQVIADRIVKSEIPVLVDFWAAWCGPCKMLNPIIAQLAKQYKGKVDFVKVNVDIHKSIARYFGVSSIPAVFLIKDKTVVRALPGLQPKTVYQSAIEEVLKIPVPITKETDNNPT